MVRKLNKEELSELKCAAAYGLAYNLDFISIHTSTIAALLDYLFKEGIIK